MLASNLAALRPARPALCAPGRCSGRATVTCAQQLLSLKEWAPTCAALGAGDQTVLLRKGGIREPTFRPEAARFALFPTTFHTEAELLKPEARQRYAEELLYDPKALTQLPISHYAELTGAWTTEDPGALAALDDLHIWTPAFLEARLRWRQQQPITVLELRAYRLTQPVVVSPDEEFWGCFSWVDLGEAATAQLTAAAKQPALDDAAFAARQAALRTALARLEAQPLEVPGMQPA